MYEIYNLNDSKSIKIKLYSNIIDEQKIKIGKSISQNPIYIKYDNYIQTIKKDIDKSINSPNYIKTPKLSPQDIENLNKIILNTYITIIILIFNKSENIFK